MANSLTDSLFGSSAATPVDSSQSGKKTDKTEEGISISTSTSTTSNNLPLSQLFDSSSTLPERPQHTNHAAAASKRTNSSKKDETTTARRNPRRRSRPSDNDHDPRIQNSAGLPTTTTTSNDDDDEEDAKDEEQRTIFVGNLPKDTTRKSLAGIFRVCGKVQSTRLRSVPTAGVKVAPEHAGNQNLVKKVSANTNKLLEDTPKKTAQGYVVFETLESVQAALRLNGTLLPGTDNLRLRIDHADPTIDSTKSVFVGNLRYGADESTLRDHFLEGCGWDKDKAGEHRDAVGAVRLIRDAETQQCKGFGYVLLKDASYVSEVLKTMHGSEYMGRAIRVMVCGTRFKGKRGGDGSGGTTKDNSNNGKRGGFKSKPRWKQQDKDKQKVKKAADGDGGAPRNKAVSSSLAGVAAKKKKRGAKKNTGVVKAAAGRANGISKRAATGKKREKRINKLQKRMTKGMGKTKKS